MHIYPVDLSNSLAEPIMAGQEHAGGMECPAQLPQQHRPLGALGRFGVDGLGEDRAA